MLFSFLSVFFSFKVLEPKQNEILTKKNMIMWKMLTQFPVGIVALVLYDVDGWLESSISMQKVACFAGARGLLTMSKTPY